MKTVVKILTALAAIIGAAYVIATYGEQIVAWAKKLLSCCPKCGLEDEFVSEEEPVAEDAAEAPVEEIAAEEVEEPVEEIVIEANEPVAEENDFAE